MRQCKAGQNGRNSSYLQVHDVCKKLKSHGEPRPHQISDLRTYENPLGFPIRLRTTFLIITIKDPNINKSFGTNKFEITFWKILIPSTSTWKTSHASLHSYTQFVSRPAQWNKTNTKGKKPYPNTNTNNAFEIVHIAEGVSSEILFASTITLEISHNNEKGINDFELINSI